MVPGLPDHMEGPSEPFGWTHRLFVYGTLKRGFTNYKRYLGVAESHGKAKYVGFARTKECFPLVVRPAHVVSTTRAPVMMDRTGTGFRVCGEIFAVDSSTLEALDILEGVRSAKYYKSQITVTLDADDSELECAAYFFPASEELLSLPQFPVYNADHHALYNPNPLKEEILNLCLPKGEHLGHGIETHGLRTKSPCPMHVHCLRLLPGEDLLRSLKKFAEEHRLGAAVVLSCVGSTGQTTLRPAGSVVPKVLHNKYEIVSLTGTLSRCSHHLHMSLSDSECTVFGGHVLEGCIVRTTAEIVLGVITNVSFTRPHDPRTGYDELSITPLLPEEDCDGVNGAAKRRRIDSNASIC